MSLSDSQKPPTPPAALPAPERDALFRALHDKHGHTLDAMLNARRDVLPASKPDVRQRVLLVLLKHLEKYGEAPKNVPGYFFDVMGKVVSNHKKRRTRHLVYGAAVEDKASSSRSPEGHADFAERSRKLEHHIQFLPPHEAQVIRCIDFLKLTLEQTAQALGRSTSTVADQYKRATKRLEELVAESERATAAGERRKPG